MIKQLTFQEVAEKLVKEGQFSGVMKGNGDAGWFDGRIAGLRIKDDNAMFYNSVGSWWDCCGIEVPDEYEPYPDDVCPPLNCGDVIISKDKKRNVLLTCCDKSGLRGAFVACGGVWLQNKELFEEYTLLDGSPIGRIKTQ